MSYISTKKLLVGAVAASMLALQVPVTAFAATDAEVYAAANAGISYLADNQNDDGSISGGIGGESDWTAIAAVAAGHDPATIKNSDGVSLLEFLETDTPSDATDVARRVLAVAATGQDSTDFGGVDYNTLLAAYHLNNQIGELTLLNDDMFGIMAVGAAEDVALMGMAQDSLNYLIANRESDGGFSSTTAPCNWSGCSDSESNSTATAIIAMAVAASLGLTNPDLEAALTDAVSYLLGAQQTDGGFGYDAYSASDGSSTAWGLMALNVFGTEFEPAATAARDWLLSTSQNDDGGFAYVAWGIANSDTYTSSNAVIAILGTTWLLSPEPIQAPVVETPEEEPAQTPVVIKTASSTPVQDTTTKKAVAQPEPQVLAAEEIATPPAQSNPNLPVEEDKKDKAAPVAKTGASKKTYFIYGLLSLGLIGFAWYLFQPKTNPTKPKTTSKSK